MLALDKFATEKTNTTFEYERTLIHSLHPIIQLLIHSYSIIFLLISNFLVPSHSTNTSGPPSFHTSQFVYFLYSKAVDSYFNHHRSHHGVYPYFSHKVEMEVFFLTQCLHCCKGKYFLIFLLFTSSIAT